MILYVLFSWPDCANQNELFCFFVFNFFFLSYKKNNSKMYLIIIIRRWNVVFLFAKKM